ncbi:DUF885 domain-containing protein [Kordiimonas pumila]|uniref:DUF885 domain-containing protein n=1 Tax=Kordiimonas pumila TaxID=2161677 RepID=A0ABV7D8Z8_9PROT|nr:DUF885 domain-containing protein [Kordiimonas pumila]
MNTNTKTQQKLSLLVSTLILSTALVACDAQSNTQTTVPETSSVAEASITESQRLNAWFEVQFEKELSFSPIQQTILGRKTDNDKLDDFSKKATKDHLNWKRASIAEMKEKFDYDKLDASAQMSWDIWEYQLNDSEAEDKFLTNAYIFDQMTSVHSFFPQLLIAFHSVDSKADLDAYIARIKATKMALEQLIERSKENAATGVHPPKFAFEFVISEAKKIITGAPFDDGEDSSIWSDAKAKIAAQKDAGNITEGEAKQLTDDARTALLEYWKPGYEDLITWQEEDIVNATAEAQGASSLPNGVDYYNERLAHNTTTDLTADEIHNIGLAEVKRLRAEMEKVKDETGFKGDLPAFFKELRDNKEDRRYYYPNTDEGRQAYIDDATAALENIKTKLPDYFGLLPKADLIVKRVEPFREQDGAPQHYFQSTPDGSRPGIYYAHLSDMTAMPKRELEVIAYHEGLPGHHMQIAIQQELKRLPTFRTQTQFTAYVEGWALYSEKLAKEMPGTYQDLYSEFGRLGSEIWRAIRLVVDTGIHSKGWTEDQAVDYFKENSAITEQQARAEVRRYFVLTGQATSYKIGMLKILELRKKAEEELADDFDIKAFHDTVLGGGALPLTILEKRVDQWIAAQKATKDTES